MSNQNQEVLYQHVTLEGTSYEIGRKQAELIKINNPMYAKFLFEGNDVIRPASVERVRNTIEELNKYCPNLNEEIKGFADYFERTPEEVIYYTFSHVSKGNCSHFAILPQQSIDGNTYVGRSYEWSADDDKLLLTIKAKGSYSHIGFSLLWFGRYDGINEKGLCVTMSNGVPCVMSQEEGLRFWMVIRILLDQCKTVEEAIEKLEKLPISSYCNLIITDQNKEAVLVEISNSIRTYQRIAASDSKGFICSTNHYTLPEMQPLVKNRMQHSVDRYNAIINTIEGNKVDKDTIKQLLSTHMPNGLACHYYSDGLGTLWSMLFDVTNCKVTICFGSPVANQWHTFDLSTKEGVVDYQVLLPNEDATPQTWQQV